MLLNKAGLLSTKGIPKSKVVSFFKRVQDLKLPPKSSSLKLSSGSSPSSSCIGILAFFETSTRTRLSFEKAGLDLGVRWMHLNPSDSSIQKGESIKDTFQTLAQYSPDFFVVRHSVAGFSHLVNRWTNLPVLNAGDGQNEHPTQGLLDAFTLWQLDSSRRWKICFSGDVSHSRVARSSLHLFRTLGFEVHLLDDGGDETRLFAKAFNVALIERKSLRSMDCVMALRVQKERGSTSQNSALSTEDLGKQTRVMHPGPVILGEDLNFDLCHFESDPRLLVHAQLRNGLRIRHLLMSDLIETLQNASPKRRKK